MLFAKTISDISSQFVTHSFPNQAVEKGWRESGQKQYYTAHGCLILPLGRKKIGKEIWVFKNEKYGREVFQCSDIRLELLSGFFLLTAVFSFSMEVIQWHFMFRIIKKSMDSPPRKKSWPSFWEKWKFTYRQRWFSNLSFAIIGLNAVNEQLIIGGRK